MSINLGSKLNKKAMVNRIKDPSGNGFHTVYRGGDFEYENPLLKVMKMFITNCITFDESLLLLQSEKHPELKKMMQNVEMAASVLLEKALNEWLVKKEKILSWQVPTVLFQVLQSKKKGNKKGY